MTGFTPWQAQGLNGIAVIQAQRSWLGNLTKDLEARPQLDSSRQAVGECLEQLLSGLLQSLVSVEEACLELGNTPEELHVAEHNALCLEVLELLQRHERGQQVGLQLLQRLQDWLAQQQEPTLH